MSKAVRSVGLAVLSAVALAASSLTPLPAEATGPVAATCGAVLTKDAYLKYDLTCPRDGVTLSGNLTFDLRGHRLIGSGGGAGITLSGLYSVKIRNGRVSHWDQGVQAVIPDSYDGDAFLRTVDVSKVKFDHNTRGLDTTNGYPYLSPIRTNFSAVDSIFDQNTDGISGVFSGNTRVSHSLFTKNFEGVGADSGQTTVYKSWLEGNVRGLGCFEGAAASLTCEAGATRFKSNDTGIDLQSTTGVATGNVFTGGSYGIDAAFSNAVARHNSFSGSETGVQFTEATGLVSKNTFTRNGTGFFAFNDSVDSPATVRDNRFSKNRNGIFVSAGTLGVGIKSNRARTNTDWGIYAPTSIDLGGNKASGNGHSPQCSGVVCS